MNKNVNENNSEEAIVPLCTDPRYSGVYANHLIDVLEYNAFIKAYKDPPLTPKNLTQDMLTFINDVNVDCGNFFHFVADPFDKSSNDDIALVSQSNVSGLFVVNYSIALFRAIINNSNDNNCQFHFSKAKVNGGFDIIFKVIGSGSNALYHGNVSSGIPWYGDFKNVP